jgi:hypothetical protein
MQATSAAVRPPVTKAGHEQDGRRDGQAEGEQAGNRHHAGRPHEAFLLAAADPAGGRRPVLAAAPLRLRTAPGSQVQGPLVAAEPGEPVGEGQREEKPEEDLHAEACHAQFLQQFGEIPGLPAPPRTPRSGPRIPMTSSPFTSRSDIPKGRGLASLNAGVSATRRPPMAVQLTATETRVAPVSQEPRSAWFRRVHELSAHYGPAVAHSYEGIERREVHRRERGVRGVRRDPVQR